jgi:hypothetical protein
MSAPAYAIGQVVFVRTDTADYAEEMAPFQTLEELVRLCTQVRQDRILERIIVYGMVNDEPHAVTFGFLSATKGERPNTSAVLDP